jgi:hypothetical protein
MAWGDFGNKPINSTTSVIVAGAADQIYAELDSTQLLTKDFEASQSRLYQVTYILGGASTGAWRVGSASSTDLAAGVDEFFPFTAAQQTAQFVIQQELKKNYRLRARTTSSAASMSAYISAVPLT